MNENDMRNDGWKYVGIFPKTHKDIENAIESPVNSAVILWSA